MPFTMKKACHAVLCALALTAVTTHATAATQRGYYWGFTGAVDAGRMKIDNQTQNIQHHLLMTGVTGGLLGGYEWIFDAPADQFHKTFALEAHAELANTRFKRTGDANGVTLRTYDIDNAVGLSMLPGVEKNGQRYFARLGWESSQYKHNDDGLAASQIPDVDARKDALMWGVGMERVVDAHWSWRAEYDHLRYGDITGTNSVPRTFVQRLRRNQYRLALTWHALARPVSDGDTMPTGWHYGVLAGMNYLGNEVLFINTGSSRDRTAGYSLTGPAVGCSLGRDWAWGKKGNLGLELAVNYADSDMHFNSGGTTFDYSNDAVAVLSIQPGWHPNPNQLVFGEVGVSGIHVKKKGAASSLSGYSPDFDRVEAGYELGVGYRSMVTSRDAIGLRAQYIDAHHFHQTSADAAATFKNAFAGPQVLFTWTRYISRSK